MVHDAFIRIWYEGIGWLVGGKGKGAPLELLQLRFVPVDAVGSRSVR